MRIAGSKRLEYCRSINNRFVYQFWCQVFRSHFAFCLLSEKNFACYYQSLYLYDFVHYLIYIKSAFLWVDYMGSKSKNQEILRFNPYKYFVHYDRLYVVLRFSAKFSCFRPLFMIPGVLNTFLAKNGSKYQKLESFHYN